MDRFVRKFCSDPKSLNAGMTDAKTAAFRFFGPDTVPTLGSRIGQLCLQAGAYIFALGDEFE
jgi:hypothetical protein